MPTGKKIENPILEGLKRLYRAIDKQYRKDIRPKKSIHFNPKYLLTVNNDGFILVDDNRTTENKIVCNF